MNAIYLHDWAESKLVGMAKDFSNYDDPPLDLSHAEIILASYTYEDYSGDAFVLFRDARDGLLYEVNGGHCSCYGLEGQWEPSLAHVDVLRRRLDEGYLGLDGWKGRNVFAAELRDAICRLETE